MNNVLTRYDAFLLDDGPAAIVTKRWLKPVGGDIISPPTYANPSQKKGDPPVYNIDRYGETSTLKKTFERFKKASLVHVLRSVGAPTTGTKTQLLDRLRGIVEGSKVMQVRANGVKHIGEDEPHGS